MVGRNVFHIFAQPQGLNASHRNVDRVSLVPASGEFTPSDGLKLQPLAPAGPAVLP